MHSRQFTFVHELGGCSHLFMGGQLLENLQGNYPQTENVCTQMPRDNPTDQMAHEDRQQKCKREMQPKRYHG